MFDRIRAHWRWLAAAAILAAALYALWSALSPKGLPPGFASGNGVILARSIQGREVNFQVKYLF